MRIYQHKVLDENGKDIGTTVDLRSVFAVDAPTGTTFKVHAKSRSSALELETRAPEDHAAFLAAWLSFVNNGY